MMGFGALDREKKEYEGRKARGTVLSIGKV